MFEREDFTRIEIAQGDSTRPPFPDELDAMVEAAELKLKIEIDRINEMRGFFDREKTERL